MTYHTYIVERAAHHDWGGPHIEADGFAPLDDDEVPSKHHVACLGGVFQHKYEYIGVIDNTFLCFSYVMYDTSTLLYSVMPYCA